VVVVVVGFLAAITPGLTAKRGYPAEIDQPASLFTSAVLPVRGGHSACMAPAVVEQHSEEAQFKVGLNGVRPQPLELRIDGPGVHVARRVAPTYADNQIVTVPVPTPHAPTVVRVCLRDLGRRPVGFYAANDRTVGRTHTSIDGRSPGPAIFLAFWERRPASLWDRLGVTMQRASVFRPGFVGPWLLWPLLVLFFIGVPAGTAWAIWRASG